MTTQNSTSLGGKQSGKVLIVDTESMLCELLQFRFEKEGFQTTVMNDGKRALATDLSDYSLILVDLMDRPFNGLQFTEEVKNNPDTVGIPIIIMSAKASEDDIVDGLDAGADDYIAKPFSSRELIARVRSVIRRRNMLNARRLANFIRFNDLTLDMGAGAAFIDGMELSLSQTEFKLLAMFLRKRNHFFERAQIRQEIWNGDSDISDRAVDTGI